MIGEDFALSPTLDAKQNLSFRLVTLDRRKSSQSIYELEC